MIEKALRILIIFVLAGALVLTTLLFQLGRNVPDAQAEVWRSIKAVARPMARFGQSREGRGEVRRVRINNNPLYYTNTTTDRPAKEVMDYYYQQYYKPEIHLFSEKVIKKLKIDSILGGVKYLQDVDRFINRRVSRIFRRDEDGFSMLGYLDMGEGDALDNYMERGKKFARTGDVNDLGVVKMALAFEEAPGQTTVLNFWTGDGFNVRNFTPDKGEDAPGEDIPGVPRMENMQRILSTGELDSLAKVRTTVYRTASSKWQTMFHYTAALPEAGWFKNDLFEKSDVKNGSNDTLLYFKDGRELTMSFRGEQDGQLLVVAIERQFKE